MKVDGADAGFEVRVDSAVLQTDAWGAAVPVDPGDHVITASVLGATRWQASAHVGPDHDAQTVVVPPLRTDAASGQPGSSAAPPPEAPPTAGRPRTVGWIVGGAGVVLLGVGTYFGVRALGNHSDATRLCPSSPCANQQGWSDNNSAKTEAWVADFGIGLGVVAVGVAAYLLFWPRHEPAPAADARVVPVVGPGSSGVAVVGRW